MKFHIKYIQEKTNKKTTNYTQFILLENDEIISSALCKDYVDEDSPSLRRYVGLNLLDLETNENYRGKGYASQLLQYIISYCRQNGYYYIILDDATDVTDKYKNIYNKFGAYVKDEYDTWVKWNNYDGEVTEERLILVNE